MTIKTDATYRAAAFARLAGVTVRALHHYDRLGLLKARRTDAGYRVYTARDLEVLEQIVALKFIGVPLKKIPVVRRATSRALADILGAQRRTLEAKQRLLGTTIETIIHAEHALRAGHDADAALFTPIIEAIEMQSNEEKWTRTYSELVNAKIARLKAMPAEERTALREQFIDLIEEIKSAVDQDPAGPAAQAFADRWVALLEQVSGLVEPSFISMFTTAEGRADVDRFTKDLSEEDRARARAAWQPVADPRVWEFMRSALAVRGR